MKKNRGILCALVGLTILLLSMGVQAIEKKDIHEIRLTKTLNSAPVIRTAFTISNNQMLPQNSAPKVITLRAYSAKTSSRPLPQNKILPASEKLSQQILQDFRNAAEDSRIIIEIYGSDVSYPLILPEEVNKVRQLKRQLTIQPNWFETIIREKTAHSGEYQIIILEINQDMEVEQKKYILNLH